VGGRFAAKTNEWCLVERFESFIKSLPVASGIDGAELPIETPTRRHSIEELLRSAETSPTRPPLLWGVRSEMPFRRPPTDLHFLGEYRQVATMGIWSSPGNEFFCSSDSSVESTYF